MPVMEKEAVSTSRCRPSRKSSKETIIEASLPNTPPADGVGTLSVL
jgi:hypothetical protein